MDSVTQFLTSEGLAPVAKYFLESEFFWGYQIELKSFRLIYRQEQERLILCDFSATERDGTAIQHVTALLRKIVKAVPQIRYVDALILPEKRDKELNQLRERLKALMIAEGAKPTMLNGEKWIRYSC